MMLESMWLLQLAAISVGIAGLIMCVTGEILGDWTDLDKVRHDRITKVMQYLHSSASVVTLGMSGLIIAIAFCLI